MVDSIRSATGRKFLSRIPNGWKLLVLALLSWAVMIGFLFLAWGLVAQIIR